MFCACVKPPECSADATCRDAGARPRARQPHTPRSIDMAIQEQQPKQDYKEAKAAAKAAKAYAKAQRPWYKKKRYILSLAAIALIAIVSAASGGSSNTATTASQPTTTAKSAPAQPEAATQTSAPAEKP